MPLKNIEEPAVNGPPANFATTAPVVGEIVSVPSELETEVTLLPEDCGDD